MHGQGRMTRLVPALLVGAMLALVAAGSVAGGAPAAHKAAKSHHPPGGGDCDGGRGIPDGKIGIQLFNFAAYIGFGTDAATQARLEEVLRRLSEIGYRNVEPFTFNGLTAAQFKALLGPVPPEGAGAARQRRDLHVREHARGLEDAGPEVRRLGRLPGAGHRQPREHPRDGHRDGRARPTVGAQRDREVLRAQPPGRVPDDVHGPGDRRGQARLAVPGREHRPALCGVRARRPVGDGRRSRSGRVAEPLRRAGSRCSTSRTASTSPTRPTRRPCRWVRGRWTSGRSWRPPGVTSTTTSTSRTRRSGIRRSIRSPALRRGFDLPRRLPVRSRTQEILDRAYGAGP